jgi:hypothetical protein
MSRRLAVAAVGICCSAGLAAPAVAAGGPTGNYATTIKGDKSLHGALNGRWVLSFAKAGTYTVADNGKIVIHGRFTTTGSTVGFGHETGPASCPTPGRYTFKLTGRTLRLKRISDVCPGRMGVLAHALTKTG